MKKIKAWAITDEDFDGQRQMIHHEYGPFILLYKTRLDAVRDAKRNNYDLSCNGKIVQVEIRPIKPKRKKP